MDNQKTFCMDNNVVINRIKQLIEQMGISQQEFAERIEMDPSNLSKYMNKKLPINKALINKIVVGLGVSKEWILNGIGEVFYMNNIKRHQRMVSVQAEDIYSIQHRGAKVYDIDVTAGSSVRDFSFANEQAIGSIDVPFIDKNSIIVRVSGDSMSPTITNGDMVAIREVKNQNLIFWGQIYVILLEDYRMVKYIRKHENSQMVILRSDNPHYDDIEVYKDQIRRLFIVENIIRVVPRM